MNKYKLAVKALELAKKLAIRYLNIKTNDELVPYNTKLNDLLQEEKRKNTTQGCQVLNLELQIARLDGRIVRQTKRVRVLSVVSLSLVALLFTVLVVATLIL